MTPFEFIYFLGYSLKKRYIMNNQKRLPKRVISLGNVTFGGTGKTPAAIALAQEARKRGFKPCILTRGYKGKAKGPCFVSRAEGPLLDENQAGDEAILMAEKLKGIPIIKYKNRYEAGLFALSSLPLALSPDLFILDDGFQHWALFRDKNILLINSMNPFGNRRLLPLGSLREPVSAISRADIVVLTNTDNAGRGKELGVPPTHPYSSRMESNGEDVRSLIEEIRQYNPKAPIFSAEHKPSAFVTKAGNTLPLAWAKNKKVFGFCGIGNPYSFKKTLLSAETDIKGLITFRDHHRYSKGDIRIITDNAKKTGSDWIVTTEKDIMRLNRFDLPENMVSLAIEFSIDGRFYDEVFH